MNWFTKIFKYMRGEDTEDNSLEENDESINKFSSKHDSSKIVNINKNTQVQVIITYPVDIDDAASVCDYINQSKICVVNLDGVDHANAQRIADFLGGAAYAISGDIQRISTDIFIVAPSNVVITGELKEQLKSSGLILPWVSSSLK